jgi:hypothetical protein
MALVLAAPPALAREGASSSQVIRFAPLELAREALAPPLRAPEDLAPDLTALGRGPIRLTLELEPSPAPERTPRGARPLVGDVLEELPLVGRAWELAGALVPTDPELVRAMTLELGGDSLLPPPLRDFGGALARGPYVRSDDANGTAISIDVRLVLAWRPDERLHFEAGYAIAYAQGEYGAQLDGSPGRQHGDFLRHGPWAGLGLDF